jgi:hypothetical protein
MIKAGTGIQEVRPLGVIEINALPAGTPWVIFSAHAGSLLTKDSDISKLAFGKVEKLALRLQTVSTFFNRLRQDM